MDLLKWFRPKTNSLVVECNPAGKARPDFSRAVDDALRLMVYAAEIGKDVGEPTRSSILRAKAAANAGWDEAVAANLLQALTKLADELKPVSAETLDASCGKLTKPTFNSLRMWALVLAFPIFVFSVLGFVTSSIASSLRTDITSANSLLIKLRSELGTKSDPLAGTPEKPLPPSLNQADVLIQLQQYAATVRSIDARARQLNWMVLRAERDPFAQLRWHRERNANESEAEKAALKKENENNQKTLKDMFELPVGVPNMPEALETITTTYQGVRSFAQDVVDLVSVSYGAITTCLLPILYALLGTCAYLLRSFEEEVRTLTFRPASRANWARFLIAGIGGAVVGLFGNFSITGEASISPLAIAFLVGYAVDVFFSFLEGMMQSLSKPKGSPVPKPTTA